MTLWLKKLRLTDAPSPVLLGVLLGLVTLPAFFIMDTVLDVSSYYLTINNPSVAWQSLMENLKFNAQVVGEHRFIFHQLFFLGLIVGGILSGWLHGADMRVRVFFSITVITRMTLSVIAAFIGGFLFYFGIMWVVLERFDYWQILSGLFQLSTSSYYLFVTAFLTACCIVKLLDKRSAS